jgi:hypothetical protein
MFNPKDNVQRHKRRVCSLMLFIVAAACGGCANAPKLTSYGAHDTFGMTTKQLQNYLRSRYEDVWISTDRADAATRGTIAFGARFIVENGRVFAISEWTANDLCQNKTLPWIDASGNLHPELEKQWQEHSATPSTSFTDGFDDRDLAIIQRKWSVMHPGWRVAVAYDSQFRKFRIAESSGSNAYDRDAVDLATKVLSDVPTDPLEFTPRFRVYLK